MDYVLEVLKDRMKEMKSTKGEKGWARKSEREVAGHLKIKRGWRTPAYNIHSWY